MFKIAVLVSGNGSNLSAVMEAIDRGDLNCSIEAVISDRKGAYAIDRAKDKNINTYVLDREVYGRSLSDEILKVVENKVDLIVLAGFLSILEGRLINTFSNRIINIHPSLIPAFCGKNMHGIKVHQGAINYGVKFSGCTVHFVDEGTDTGPIILQRVVPVFDNDTPEKLQKRILKEEHEIICEAIGYIAENKVRIDGRRVVIEKPDEVMI